MATRTLPAPDYHIQEMIGFGYAGVTIFALSPIYRTFTSMSWPALWDDARIVRYPLELLFLSVATFCALLVDYFTYSRSADRIGATPTTVLMTFAVVSLGLITSDRIGEVLMNPLQGNGQVWLFLIALLLTIAVKALIQNIDLVAGWRTATATPASQALLKTLVALLLATSIASIGARWELPKYDVQDGIRGLAIFLSGWIIISMLVLTLTPWAQKSKIVVLGAIGGGVLGVLVVFSQLFMAWPFVRLLMPWRFLPIVGGAVAAVLMALVLWICVSWRKSLQP